MNRLSLSSFALIDRSVEKNMRDEVEAARLEQDSIGGSIECAVTGMPVGVGEPMFDGVEGAIAKAVFGVPAVKGIEFGAGFELAKMRGSQANDPFRMKDGKVVTETNNNADHLPRGDKAHPVNLAEAAHCQFADGRKRGA